MEINITLLYYYTMYKNSVDSIVENVSRVLHDSLKPFLNELETNAKFGERFLSLIS